MGWLCKLGRHHVSAILRAHLVKSKIPIPHRTWNEQVWGGEPWRGTLRKWAGGGGR